MKRQFFILSLSTLTLFSCGGSQQNKTTETTETTENTETTKREEVKESVKVPESFMNFMKKLSDKPDKPVYFLSDLDNNDNYVYCGNYYYAYPQKNGGYTTVYKRIDSAEYGSMTNWSKAFTFKNGEVSNAEKTLPVPDVSLMIDDSKKAGHEADVKGLTALYNKRSGDFLHYVFSDTEPLVRVEFEYPYGDSEWKESYSEIVRYGVWTTYKWDGEKFAPCNVLEEFVKTLPATSDKPVYHKLDSYDIVESYCQNNDNYYALPMKDGGYMAVADYNSQCEASMSWSNETFTYKNGKLTKVDNVLPVPEATELLDAEKCKSDLSKTKEIKKQYSSRPKDFLLYSIDENGSLSVSMEGNGCEQWGEDDLSFMTSAVYEWDGERFVKGGSDGGQNIAMQVWDVLLKRYDPFGYVEEGKEPPTEMIIESLKHIQEKSPTIAVLTTESEVEGFSETLSCYKHNNGSWLVIDYWQSLDSPDKKLKFFEFKNEKLKRLDKYYPDDFLSGGRYLGSIEADGFSVVRDTDDAEEVVWYKWNGERFDKQ